jgi:elongation factor G
MIETLRNIGIIAHVDAGKTTTTERILYFAGAKHKAGDVDSGNTTTDFDPLEAEKGITISSAAVSVDWAGHRITIIDTPGHVDFTAEVERSLRVLDGAVGVFCAVGGVEVQSETVWHQADRHGVPRLCFVNKLDRTGADFFGCVEQIEQKLGARVAVCALPAGQGSEFQGVIDLVRMKFCRLDPEDPRRLREELVEIPAAFREEANLARERLLDALSHVCDEVLTCLVEGQPVDEAVLRRALRQGTLQRQVFPVLCGSAYQYQGVRLLMDAITQYLPSPADRPPVEGLVPQTKEKVQRRPEAGEPLAALAFKTVSEAHGDVVYLRIYSGRLQPGMTVLNSVTGRTERISHIYRMMGARRDRLEEAGPGDIVAAVGLKQTATGNTLCAPQQPVLLEEIRFPEPVISQAITPARNVDETRLSEALARMVRDDPTLRCWTNTETNQLILSGMGELHLEVAVHKLQRDHKVQVTVGKPMVSYRQTLARPVEVENRFIKQTGGRGQYAVVVLRLEPLTREQREVLEAQQAERGEKGDPNGLYFFDEIVGGVVPGQYVPAVEKGFREAARRGGKYGFQFVDIKCTLVDGKHHEVDSSQHAFQRCAEEAFQEAIKRAGVVLLEPIMKVQVTAPGQYLGDLTRDISRRRGEILNSHLEKGRAQLTAYVPLACLMGYMSDLRNFSSGTASFTMEPSHYAPVKEEMADLRAAS